MAPLYTLAIWTTKPGREEDFVVAWRELGRWTLETRAELTSGTLLQDRERPTRFVSFGPWPSLAAIDEWRSAPGFGERLGRIETLLQNVEPGTFDLRAQMGEPR